MKPEHELTSEEFEIGDDIIHKDHLEILLTAPPRIATGVWTVTEKCSEHPKCWIAICGAMRLHTFVHPTSYIVVHRNGDPSIGKRINEKKLDLIAQYLVRVLGKNPEDIVFVAARALGEVRKG